MKKARQEAAVHSLAMGDQGMFVFIIRNLLSNAIKFTPAYGTVKILARTEVTNCW